MAKLGGFLGRKRDGEAGRENFVARMPAIASALVVLDYGKMHTLGGGVMQLQVLWWCWTHLVPGR